MRIKPPITLTAVVAVVLLGGVGVIGCASVDAIDDAVAPTSPDGTPEPLPDTFITGVPAPEDGTVIDAPAAPVFATPGQLAAGGAVTLQPGQMLLVVPDGRKGGAFTGTGGSGDEGILLFEPADSVDDASFFARKPGKTTAWIAGTDGQRVSFDVTVATS